MEKIIAVDRNRDGEIISFKTDTNRVISYQKALQDIENGIIGGVEIVEGDAGHLQILDIEGDCLDFKNLPSIY